MILVDTSIWIDHLHSPDPELVDLLGRSMVLQHPMVIGELDVGSLRDRANFLGLLANLPVTPLATYAEVMVLVDRHQLFGRGLSLVDAHLLAAAVLAPGTRLWTRDERLQHAAWHLEVVHIAQA